MRNLGLVKALLLVGMILACLQARGALAVVQHVANHVDNHAAAVSCTLSATGAARNLIVGFAIEPGPRDAGSPILSIVDNKGNTYVSAVESTLASPFSQRTGVWHSLNAISGVTTITITFNQLFTNWDSTPNGPGYKGIFCYEVSGAATFDAAAKVDDSTCTSVCTGASVTTATTIGFVLGVIIEYDIGLNPNTGNEFTSGGDSDNGGWSAAASLISSTAAAHQPAWADTAFIWTKHFSSSTAAYKQ